MFAATTRKHLLPTRCPAGLLALPRPLVRQGQGDPNGRVSTAEFSAHRHFVSTSWRRNGDASVDMSRSHLKRDKGEEAEDGLIPASESSRIGSHEQKHEHAVISAFDLFSIGGAFARPASDVLSIAYTRIGQTQSNVVLDSWP